MSLSWIMGDVKNGTWLSKDSIVRGKSWSREYDNVEEKVDFKYFLNKQPTCTTVGQKQLKKTNIPRSWSSVMMEVVIYTQYESTASRADMVKVQGLN